MHSLFAVYMEDNSEKKERERRGKKPRGPVQIGETERCREVENKPIQRYRIQAKADKPTTLERACAVGVPREDGWNAPRTGRKAADIPKFATASAQGNVSHCTWTKLPWSPDEMSEKIAARPLVLSTFSQRCEITDFQTSVSGESMISGSTLSLGTKRFILFNLD